MLRQNVKESFVIHLLLKNKKTALTFLKMLNNAFSYIFKALNLFFSQQRCNHFE